MYSMFSHRPLFLSFILLLTIPSQVPASSTRNSFVYQFRELGLAIHNFLADNNGNFPSDILDPQGKPLLSWRVALLPYVYADRTMFSPWLISRAIGCLVCWVALVRMSATWSTRTPFLFLAILLLLGVGDARAQEWWRPNEALATIPPPYVTLVATAWLAAVSWVGPYAPPGRVRAHRCGLLAGFVPIVLFSWWKMLGLAAERNWFAYVLRVRE